MAERRNQLARGLVAFAAHTQAAVNDLLELITAGQFANIAAADRAGDVAAQQHDRDQPDLVDIIALLPAAHLPPGDLRWHVEQVERIGSNPSMAELVRRDPKVAKLQLLAFAHEDVERRQVAVERLSPMQHIEDRQDSRQLAADEALGLRSLAREPRAEIAVFRILHDEAITRARTVDDDEPVENSQRAGLAVQELGEVRLAQPRGEALGDLDAHLRRESAPRRGRGKVHLPEAALAEQLVQVVRPVALGAIGGRQRAARRRRETVAAQHRVPGAVRGRCAIACGHGSPE